MEIEYTHKEMRKRFYIIFSVHIYSEQRTDEGMYKHFVTFYCFGFKLFHTFWRTGGGCEDFGFYHKDGSFGKIEKRMINND